MFGLSLGYLRLCLGYPCRLSFVAAVGSPLAVKDNPFAYPFGYVSVIFCLSQISEFSEKISEDKPKVNKTISIGYCHNHSNGLYDNPYKKYNELYVCKISACLPWWRR